MSILNIMRNTPGITISDETDKYSPQPDPVYIPKETGKKEEKHKSNRKHILTAEEIDKLLNKEVKSFKLAWLNSSVISKTTPRGFNYSKDEGEVPVYSWIDMYILLLKVIIHNNPEDYMKIMASNGCFSAGIKIYSSLHDIETDSDLLEILRSLEGNTYLSDELFVNNIELYCVIKDELYLYFTPAYVYDIVKNILNCFKVLGISAGKISVHTEPLVKTYKEKIKDSKPKKNKSDTSKIKQVIDRAKAEPIVKYSLDRKTLEELLNISSDRLPIGMRICGQEIDGSNIAINGLEHLVNINATYIYSSETEEEKEKALKILLKYSKKDVVGITSDTFEIERYYMKIGSNYLCNTGYLVFSNGQVGEALKYVSNILKEAFDIQSNEVVISYEYLEFDR